MKTRSGGLCHGVCRRRVTHTHTRTQWLKASLVAWSRIHMAMAVSFCHWATEPLKDTLRVPCACDSIILWQHQFLGRLLFLLSWDWGWDENENEWNEWKLQRARFPVLCESKGNIKCMYRKANLPHLSSCYLGTFLYILIYDMAWWTILQNLETFSKYILSLKEERCEYGKW